MKPLWCYLLGKPLLEKREKGRTPSYFSVSILEIGGGKLTGRRSRPPAKRNEESAPHLKFERIPNGFKVCRESPFLVVERWLADNRIHGRSATKDKSGREMPTLFVPLTITGENEASFPPDPMGKSVPLTAGDVAGGVLGFF